MTAGDVIGRYRLVKVLGRGGMGTVWQAAHGITGRQVAVKVLDGMSRRDVHGRFLREARASAAIDHPAIVPVHDVLFLDDGTPALVMDLLEGETLRERLERAPSLSLEDSATVLLGVVSAVGAAHARGIVHRDLKPENVFLVGRNTGGADVRVLDFGVAKVTQSGPATAAGAAIGTPAYMAPEQALGRDVDHRADVFSLGILLYEAVSGVRPIEGSTPAEITRRLLEDGMTPLEAVEPDAPEELCSLTRRMLARAPEERPALSEVARTLAAFTPFVAHPFGDPGADPASFDAEPDGAPAPGRRSRTPQWILIAALAAFVALPAAWISATRTSATPGPQPVIPTSNAPEDSVSAPAPSLPGTVDPPRTAAATRATPPPRAVAAPTPSVSTPTRPPAPTALPSPAGGLIEHPPF